jgi:aconitate hydratase
MGILPIVLPKEAIAGRFNYEPGNRIFIDATTVRPRSEIHIRIDRNDGSKLFFRGLIAIETELELMMMEAGGLIPLVLSQAIAGIGSDKRGRSAAGG